MLADDRTYGGFVASQFEVSEEQHDESWFSMKLLHSKHASKSRWVVLSADKLVCFKDPKQDEEQRLPLHPLAVKLIAPHQSKTPRETNHASGIDESDPTIASTVTATRSASGASWWTSKWASMPWHASSTSSSSLTSTSTSRGNHTRRWFKIQIEQPPGHVRTIEFATSDETEDVQGWIRDIEWILDSQRLAYWRVFLIENELPLPSNMSLVAAAAAAASSSSSALLSSSQPST